MKNLLKNAVFGFLLPISNFVVDPVVEQGNEAYKEERYEDAYERFAAYLFHSGTSGTDEDYYIALLGKSSCMRRLQASKMFEIERSFFEEVAKKYDILSDEQKELFSDVLQNCSYYDFAE